jgi:DNA-binding CsgD family transcriptional regulator
VGAWDITDGRRVGVADVRRIAAVLDAIDHAESLREFTALTLAALDEHLGIRRSAFMLALAERPLPGRVAFAGANHGLRPYVMEEYFERWSHIDALTSDPARAAYVRNGHVTMAGIYQRLEPQHRRYVDDFLRRSGDREQLSFLLPCAGWTDGYLTVTGEDPPGERELRLLAAVVSPLAERLARHLPRGLGRDLSPRESQVAELVALGFTNREIAQTMGIEEDTAKKHVWHATGKLGLRGRTELAVSWSRGQRLELPQAVVSA